MQNVNVVHIDQVKIIKVKVRLAVMQVQNFENFKAIDPKAYGKTLQNLLFSS